MEQLGTIFLMKYQKEYITVICLNVCVDTNIYFCDLAIFLKASKGMLGYLNWKPFLLYLVYCTVLPQKGIGKKNNQFQY